MPLNVLLVDDDALLLRISARTLQSAGCRVFAFSDPYEALRFFEASPSRIDILVTDIVMPDLDGFDLACGLFARRPGLPVVFMSGFYPEGLPRLLPFPFRLLPKPFTSAGLIEAVLASVGPLTLGLMKELRGHTRRLADLADAPLTGPSKRNREKPGGC